METFEADLRSALAHVIQSAAFNSSPRLAELLTYLVEQTVQGHADRLKGYTIALDVFGRDESFDPGSDSLVRVQMSRLRKALAEYYAHEGRDESRQISIPRGSYVPELIEHAESESAATKNEAISSPESADLKEPAGQLRQNRKSWALLGLLVVMVVALLYYWQREPARGHGAGVMPQGPTVYVVPFSVDAQSREALRIREGLRFDLTNYLTQFPNIAVVDVESVDQFRKSPKGRLNRPQAAFMLDGSVATAGNRLKINTRLLRVADGVVVWSRSSEAIEYRPTQIIDQISNIALGVASQLGQPYGVIYEVMRQDRDNHRGVSMQHYYCELSAFEFMRVRKFSDLAEIRECLKRAVQDNPEYSDGWALLSWLDTYEAISQGTGRSQSAIDAAKRAVQANPTNALAYQYLAIALFYNGQFDAAHDAIGKALQISPNNSEILADGGRLLAILGADAEAPELSKKAIQLNPGHPAWYWQGLVINALQRGDAEEAVKYARHLAEDEGMISQYLVASALALAGRPDEARAAIDRAAKIYPMVARDRRLLVREMHFPEFIVRPLEEGGILSP